MNEMKKFDVLLLSVLQLAEMGFESQRRHSCITAFESSFLSHIASNVNLSLLSSLRRAVKYYHHVFSLFCYFSLNINTSDIGAYICTHTELFMGYITIVKL